jgi:trehalose 6-phosphate phosphatase
MKPTASQIRYDQHAIFLDVDGTLLDIAERPEDVHADEELIALLQTLLSLFDGAMALVSGRSIGAIDQIFGDVHFPAVGAHGAELRHSTETDETSTPEPFPDLIRARLQQFADRHAGLQLENKQGGVSLHYRRAPELAEQCRQLIDELMPELEPKFRLIKGKMVFEIAPRDHNKGDAIRKLLHAPEFDGRRPVFIGDDVTDEDGFSVVNELRGISIRVGRDRPTEARFALDNVAEVRDFLQSIVENNGARRASRRKHVDQS